MITDTDKAADRILDETTRRLCKLGLHRLTAARLLIIARLDIMMHWPCTGCAHQNLTDSMHLVTTALAEMPDDATNGHLH
ncbi:MAG: hypothetical protein GEU95_10545 [Rhizobiales bacterium]|nr:hypothetical protein [Hyphomicrobiales bacterium]